MANALKPDNDERLNPGQRNYEADFNGITNQPNKKAPDDQGNAIASNYSAGQNIKNPDQLAKAEASPEKQGFYSGKGSQSGSTATGGTSQTRLQAIGQKLGGKKGAAIGGVLGAGLITSVMIFMALLPLKVIGLVDSLTDKAGEIAQNITEKRAGKIIVRKIVSETIGKKAGATAGLAISKGPIAAIRTDMLEKRLADKGITMDENGLKLKDGTNITYNNPAELEAALNENKLTNQTIRTIVKEDIPTWRWMKRAKFTKFLRIKYGVKRFGVKEKTDQGSGEKNARATAKAELTDDFGSQVDDTGKALDCVLSGSCPEGVDADPDTKAKDSSTSSETKAAIDEAKKEIADELESNTGDDSKKSSGFITKRLGKLIGDKLAARIVGGTNVVMAIDTAATVYYLISEASVNKVFIKLPAWYKSQQYVKQYADAAGCAGQQKAGRMSPEYAGVCAAKFDADPNAKAGSALGSGSESSVAFNAINGNAEAGIKLTEAEKIYDDPNRTNAAQEFVDALQNGVLQEIAEAWVNTFGEFLSFVGAFIGGAAEGAAEFIGVDVDAMKDNVSSFLKNTLIDALGLDVVSPSDTGAKYYNNISAGASKSFNDFTKETLGGKQLSDGQAAELSRQIAVDREEYEASKGLGYRLFNTENTRSLVSQLAINLPSTANNSVLSSTSSSALAMIASAPSRLASTASPKASAAPVSPNTFNDLFGVMTYGATEEELNQEVSDAVINGESCGTADELAQRDTSQFNLCMADQAVAESISCALDNDPKSDECSGINKEQAVTASSSGGDPNVPPGTFVFPAKQSDAGSLNISSCYGWRSISGGTPWHPALDIGTAKKQGVPAYAAGAGTVVRSEVSNGYGNFVVIKHAEGLYTHYAHMASRTVNVGDTVNAGQQVGVIGNTGGRNGVVIPGVYATHLDFGFSTDGSGNTNPNAGTSINPLKYLTIPSDIPNAAGCSADKEDYR